MRDADVVGGGDDLVALLEARVARGHDHAAAVDAADAGEAPDDLACAGGGQGVLEVDAREGGLDRHLARIQLVERHLDQPARRPCRPR